MTEVRRRAGSTDDDSSDADADGPGADELSPEALRESMRAVDDVVGGSPSRVDARGSSTSLRSRARAWLSRGRAGRTDDGPPRDVADGLADDLSDEGMATAEYAIATVAAAGFAGLLIVILRSDEVRGMLLDIVRGALAM